MPACITALAGSHGILMRVCKNPTQPVFNHYLFESVAALVKQGCAADPNTVPQLEQMLMPAFQYVLQEDVQVSQLGLAAAIFSEAWSFCCLLAIACYEQVCCLLPVTCTQLSPASETWSCLLQAGLHFCSQSVIGWACHEHFRLLSLCMHLSNVVLVPFCSQLQHAVSSAPVRWKHKPVVSVSVLLCGWPQLVRQPTSPTNMYPWSSAKHLRLIAYA